MTSNWKTSNQIGLTLSLFFPQLKPGNNLQGMVWLGYRHPSIYLLVIATCHAMSSGSDISCLNNKSNPFQGCQTVKRESQRIALSQGGHERRFCCCCCSSQEELTKLPEANQVFPSTQTFDMNKGEKKNLLSSVQIWRQLKMNSWKALRAYFLWLTKTWRWLTADKADV